MSTKDNFDPNQDLTNPGPGGDTQLPYGAEEHMGSADNLTFPGPDKAGQNTFARGNVPLHTAEEIGENQKASSYTAGVDGEAAAMTTKLAGVTPEQRYLMIQQLAFEMARKHGFMGGKAAEDWLLAEEEIDRRLHKQASQRPVTEVTTEELYEPEAPLPDETDADQIVHSRKS